jgi:hypothetical protein
MDISFISLIIFIIITIVYYLVLKPKLEIDMLGDLTEYTNSCNIMLLVYFLLIIIVQIALNTGIIVNKCGGNISQNFGIAFLITIIPWIFIFGAVITVLLIFPGFKEAFSNVIGYFAVSGSANKILTELLVNTDLNQTIDDSTVGNVQKNKDLKMAAEAIIKVCGNMSIIINQIVPENFNEYWAMLTPLMKEQYQNSDTVLDLKQQLLDTVVTRNNVGEALWYVYTAILLISITQYSITSRKCTKDLVAMQASQQQYQEQEAATQEANAKAESTVYTY